MSRTLTSSTLIVSLWAAGCAGAVTDEDDVAATEPLGTVAEALWTAENMGDIYPNAGSSRIDINVCWENPTAKSATWRNERRKAVESTWSRYGRVNFNQWDTCAPEPAFDPGLHILICTASSPACSNWPGSQTDGLWWADGMRNGIELSDTNDVWHSIHEVGHALGFYHEQERPDFDGLDGCGIQTPPNLPQYYGGYDRTSVMSTCGHNIDMLSPNDTASIQRSYGRRIPGTLISPQANCAAAHYANGPGDPAFMYDCDEAFDDQEWHMRASSNNDYYLELTSPLGPVCMAASSATDGAGVALASCSTSKDWTFENIYLRGFGGLCLNVPGGNTTNGTPLRMWECNSAEDLNERFSIASNSKIKFGNLSSNKCIRNVGWSLQIWDCGATNETMTLDSLGQISNLGKCMDVFNVNDAQYTSGQGGPANGNSVGFVDCNGSMNQKWNLFGAIKYGANRSLCLTREGADGNGTLLALRPCDGRQTEGWDYYFRL